MLYFGDPNAPIDYREQMWGHAIHGSTFETHSRPRIDPKTYPWWKRHRIKHDEKALDAQEERLNVRRYSFLCHSSRYPKIGMKVIWKTAEGDRQGTIYEIEPCRDPRDMFKLFVVVQGTGAPDE